MNGRAAWSWVLSSRAWPRRHRGYHERSHVQLCPNQIWTGRQPGSSPAHGTSGPCAFTAKLRHSAADGPIAGIVSHPRQFRSPRGHLSRYRNRDRHSIPACASRLVAHGQSVRFYPQRADNNNAFTLFSTFGLVTRRCDSPDGIYIFPVPGSSPFPLPSRSFYLMRQSPPPTPR